MKKTKFLIFSFSLLSFSFSLFAYAQDTDKISGLTRQAMEAKTTDGACAVLEQLTDLYFKDNKYNEYVEFLRSLYGRRKDLEPVANYYIALSRYYQLQHLEEAQEWDEYFSQGNNYREQLTQAAQAALAAFAPADAALGVYTRLILWKFHNGQQDVFREGALSELMVQALAYAKDAKNVVPIKDAADQLLAGGEKARARELYRIYLDKIVSSDIKEDELSAAAGNFFKEGNLELAQGLYEIYIARITKSPDKEKLLANLIDIARRFAYRDDGPCDPVYAERVFKKIEETGGKEAFDEGLTYLRAFNLEKMKDYIPAREVYMDLASRFPKSAHIDEADFKTGIIYTYVARDINNGRLYFEKLANNKETLSPQAISSLYQLGLLAQWQEDFAKAKEYYNKLLERANVMPASFSESISLAQQRLKEIEGSKQIEYNLKTFMDISLKKENAGFNMSKLQLNSRPYRLKITDESTKVTAYPFIAESGCLQVEMQYLWSGDIGTAEVSLNESNFDTAYKQAGTRVINLVVVSTSGFLDYNIDMVDVQ